MFIRGRLARPIATMQQRGRRVFAIARVGLLTASAIAFVGHAAVAAPQSTNQPDILMLVYAGSDGKDTVGLTYPTAIPHARAKADIQALAASNGWTPSHVNIADAPAPFVGAKQLMTSVDFVAHVIPPQPRYLPLEPVVSALRNYPHVAITYMMSDKPDFQGLRDYSDKYVSIKLDERGNAFTYHVHAHDRTFQKLNLPLYQAPPSQTKLASAPAPRRGVNAWQVMLVTFSACIAGGAVYFVMSRNAAA